MTQANTTAGRRPTASDSQAQNRRPKIAMPPNQIIRYDASFGLIFSTKTRRVVSHNVSPTVPVWLMPVRQATIMLRLYLNSSTQRTGSAAAPMAGSWMVAGSTMSAHARDWRASWIRPLPISQCGDSGTHARISSVIAAGSKPTTNRPRQPISGSSQVPAIAPNNVPTGSRLVVRPVIQPRRFAGTNSCTMAISTV